MARRNFQFHNGITGIVGPNGSGKSNVADAVRWVLVLRLNFTIPAASSKSSLRSSGLPLRILSIWPWPMME